MQNVVLVKGQCPGCGGQIDSKSHQSLGRLCLACSRKDPKVEIFKPLDINLQATPAVDFDPITGRYEYLFDWSGTSVKVNGKVGVIRSTSGSSSRVVFPGHDQTLGDPIYGLGDTDLLKVFEQLGGQINPPHLEFTAHLPSKCALLDEPISPVEIVRGKNGNILGVAVGNRQNKAPEFSFYWSLHAFCNYFVRWKYALLPNFTFEGGFIGRDFEVKNRWHGQHGNGYCGSEGGLRVRDFRQGDKSEETHIGAQIASMVEMIYQCEQKRIESQFRDADVEVIISCWHQLMRTLLRYSWHEMEYRTVEDVWQCYCRMQDVLLNVLTEEESLSALAWMRANGRKLSLRG